MGVYNSTKVLLLLDKQITKVEILAKKLNKREKQNKKIIYPLCFAVLTSSNSFLRIISL